MIGGAAGIQIVDGGFQIRNRGDQLRVGGGCVGKTDNANPTAGADISVLDVVGGFLNDIHKSLCAGFHICKGSAAHAAGAVQD